MIYNEQTAERVANILLEIGAVKLNLEQPFTWASGWKSPIYCDNRQTLSFPAARKVIREKLAEGVREKFPEVEVIAGVATGAIAHGVLVAEEMGLPFIYVRSSAKKHGLTNQVEGKVEPGKKVVVIEDLISSGGSSLAAVDALKEADVKVIGLAAIFSYGFPAAEKAFAAASCPYFTLSNYEHLLPTAVNANLIKQAHLETLKKWRLNPSEWLG